MATNLEQKKGNSKQKRGTSTGVGQGYREVGGLCKEGGDKWWRREMEVL